jgi:hypothetical protein
MDEEHLNQPNVPSVLVLTGLGERMLVRFAKSLGEQKFSGATAKYTLANA